MCNHHPIVASVCPSFRLPLLASLFHNSVVGRGGEKKEDSLKASKLSGRVVKVKQKEVLLSLSPCLSFISRSGSRSRLHSFAGAREVVACHPVSDEK